MNPAILFRAIRRARRLSQRELAAVAYLPPTTIDRIESGRTSAPTLRTIETVLHATGYQLVVADNRGWPFTLDEVHGRLRDRSDRQFPAHLPVRRLNWEDRWWGWSRIAWLPSDPNAPEWVYDLRSTRTIGPWHPDRRWDEAT